MLNVLLILQNELDGRTPGSHNWFMTVDRIVKALLRERIEQEETKISDADSKGSLRND